MAKKILTVDDSKTIRLIVGRAFKPYDCDIIEAANGVEGLAAAEKDKPDIIILDLTMPVMDGYEMLTKLKAAPDLAKIPVIMLTAEAGKDNVLRIAKLGVRDYLIKPFKEEVILERVGRVIELKKKEVAVIKPKFFDSPVKLLIVDDKPAIIEQIRNGLASTPWKVEGIGEPAKAVEFCKATPPDFVCVSLSLPDNSGFTLNPALRALPALATAPIFGLCVKTATADQDKAQATGFNGVVTKPIDFEHLQMQVCQALQLDVSGKYFKQRDNVVVFSIPGNLNAAITEEISKLAPARIAGIVDEGLDKVVVDFSQVKEVNPSLVQLCVTTVKQCEQLSLKYSLVGSEATVVEFTNHQDSKGWRFETSLDAALAALTKAA